ncbi:MAG: hypothetical protein C0622_11360 [Desulfuromonas sp.]|nr:MAG: hypothetical protein C0622_11360 [Desulfuromonas sp.]
MGNYTSGRKTRAALIDAAGSLAAEKGFSSVSTRMIAELSGENIGSIHYHFGGKQQLFDAVVATVAERWQDKPLSRLLTHCDLTTLPGQAEAVELVVRREAALLFDPEAPVWHCRVIYQLLHFPDPLRDAFRHAVIGPESETIIQLIQTIKPGLDPVTAHQYMYLITAPLFLHVDYREALLERLGMNGYDATYIESLTHLCVRQALLLLNLPVRETL